MSLRRLCSSHQMTQPSHFDVKSNPTAQSLLTVLRSANRLRQNVVEHKVPMLVSYLRVPLAPTPTTFGNLVLSTDPKYPWGVKWCGTCDTRTCIVDKTEIRKAFQTWQIFSISEVIEELSHSWGKWGKTSNEPSAPEVTFFTRPEAQLAMLVHTALKR